MCWAVGATMLWLTFRLVHKEKFAFAFFAFIAALVFCACGLTWVQGLMKTEIISVVTRSMKEYGKKLDEFQNTTTNIHTELDQHQKDLEVQQAQIRKAQTNIVTQEDNITNQYAKIASLQSKLEATETNIAEQEKRIEDVEFLVKNLFSKMTNELVSGTDSNLVTVLCFTNGASQVFIKLQNAPIAQSLNCIVHGNVAQYPLESMLNVRNVVTTYFLPGNNPRDLTFNFQYVPDTRETNRYNKITFEGTKVFFDGQHFIFNQDRESGNATSQ
jgi:uncharacterized membrane protein YhiD involved in acid resistance